MRIIVTNVHELLRDKPSTTAHPSQEFIECCNDDAIESLGLQESEYEWEDEDMLLVQMLLPRSEAQIGPREETPLSILPPPTTDPLTTPGLVTTP